MHSTARHSTERDADADGRGRGQTGEGRRDGGGTGRDGGRSGREAGRQAGRETVPIQGTHLAAHGAAACDSWHWRVPALVLPPLASPSSPSHMYAGSVHSGIVEAIAMSPLMQRVVASQRHDCGTISGAGLRRTGVIRRTGGHNDRSNTTLDRGGPCCDAVLVCSYTGQLDTQAVLMHRPE